MYKIEFTLSGDVRVAIDANSGENLLELARKANVAIDAPCSGNGSCGKCRVRLVQGQVDSAPSRHISEEEYADGWRLACCSTVSGDAVIEVPDIASAYRSRMKVADLDSPAASIWVRRPSKMAISSGESKSATFMRLR